MNYRYYKIKETSKYKPYRKINNNLITTEIDSYLKDFETLISVMNIKNKNLYEIANIIGYDIDIRKLKSTGGTCDSNNKIITIKPFKSILKTKRVFCHEFAHAIQAELGILKRSTSLSYYVYIEQQAESIAHRLFNILFPQNKHQINKVKFNAYFNFKDIEFLYAWYKEKGIPIRNDLFVKQS